MAIRRTGLRAPAKGHTLPLIAMVLGLLAYMLLPVLHAGHHWLEGGSTGVSGVVAGGASEGCGHHCHDGHKDPASGTDNAPPGEESPGHDHSSCEVCQAMHAARKGIELPAPVAVPVAALLVEVCGFVPPTAHPIGRHVEPRTSRGPPMMS